MTDSPPSPLSLPSVAVVGTGYWGKNLVRNFANIGCLSAICDSKAKNLAPHKLNYPDVECFENIDALAASDAIEAVVIATPAATHATLAKKFLRAGKHVFVEKPLCLDPVEGEALKKLADEQNKTLMVGHLLLYHPAFVALRECVESGRVGDLRYIYSNRASLGKIRTEENALWSFAPHDVSMILALAGRTPSRVVANGANYITDGVADMTLSHLTFTENLQAHIFVSWLHPFKDHRLVVVGSEGMIVFNDVEQEDNKLLLYPHKTLLDDELPVVSKADAEPVRYSRDEPLELECRHFLQSINNCSTPRSSADEGIAVLKVLRACEEAIISGQPVEMGT
jgi:UDP-2-acetamido-3-amino-2,3-dideoxy-glucuronate N-acetyltransferase